MAFYLPIERRWTAASGCADSPYDPLSVDCPPLDFRQVRGMLKGFIDLVFRHNGRYYLLDYKSNWLGKTARPIPGGDGAGDAGAPLRSAVSAL
jgi:exodeoxyribonuclease V beta subunit